MNQDLLNLANKTADFLETVDEPILCFSHYDCDGISASIIVHQMLERAGKEFEQVFLDELTEEKLRDRMKGRDQQVVLFTDIGSGQVNAIHEVVGDRQVVIIDHHEVQDGEEVEVHVNPHLVGIDGGEDISGAGVTYLVARCLDEANQDLVRYALIGATGDMQMDGDEYIGLNTEFVDEARDQGLIEVNTGLKLFGRSGKSLVRALMYTTDPYLKGITNNESGAVHFLNSIGLDLHDEDGNWRSLADLSEEEERLLVHELIVRGYGNIEKLLGNVYLLDNGWEIREFSSLLNACGRLEQPEAGLDICLDDDFDLAYKMKRKYGRKIGKYLSFVEDNMENSEVVRDIDSGTIITAGGKIHANMIGTVASICISSDIVPGPVVIGMAEKEGGFVKISGRVKRELVAGGFAMNRLMETACAEVGGEGGGHTAAAGGKIPVEEQERFIKVMNEVVKESVSDSKTA